ncbi:MAG: putative F420-dependent oxidoreductase [Halieaceae bacterium]|jgi:probable F420-dependent oxidoreductase
MQVMTVLPQQDLNNVQQSAEDAEFAGYDQISTMENRHEPFMPLGVAAISTKKIKVGTAVAIAFPRSPMVIANTCWDLQKASHGRFVLGLGPQIKAHNVSRFSVPWSAPVPRMREYVNALRAIWRNWQLGEKLEFRGEHYKFTLMTPNFVPDSTDQPPVPVTIAAVGPNMLKLAGEACDGVHLHPFCTRAYIEDVAMPRIKSGLAESAKPREEFQISGGGFLATGQTDEEVAGALEWVRYRIAFYGSTPSYWPVLEHHDLGDLGRKLNTMTKAGLWDQLAAEISDDVLSLFAAFGRYDQIATSIEQRFGGAIDMMYASLSSDNLPVIPADVLQDIQRISVPFKGFRSTW